MATRAKAKTKPRGRRGPNLFDEVIDEALRRTAERVRQRAMRFEEEEETEDNPVAVVLFSVMSPECRHRIVTRKDYDTKGNCYRRAACTKLNADNDACTIGNCPLLKSR